MWPLRGSPSVTQLEEPRPPAKTRPACCTGRRPFRLTVRQKSRTAGKRTRFPVGRVPFMVRRNDTGRPTAFCRMWRRHRSRFDERGLQQLLAPVEGEIKAWKLVARVRHKKQRGLSPLPAHAPLRVGYVLGKPARINAVATAHAAS